MHGERAAVFTGDFFFGGDDRGVWVGGRRPGTPVCLSWSKRVSRLGGAEYGFEVEIVIRK